MIQLKRIYDPISEDDGYRILVDRLWPRGVSKENARIDLWMKEVAPSTELRKWFHQENNNVTLLFSAKDREKNQAKVLSDVLSTLK